MTTSPAACGDYALSKLISQSFFRYHGQPSQAETSPRR
jgi:hypothetical protein